MCFMWWDEGFIRAKILKKNEDIPYSLYFFTTFAVEFTISSWAVRRFCFYGKRGKSGQHRAFRFLMGSRSWERIRAEENNRHFSARSRKVVGQQWQVLWEVRVRRWGKSPPVVWWHTSCAPRKLKVHVNWCHQGGSSECFRVHIRG